MSEESAREVAGQLVGLFVLLEGLDDLPPCAASGVSRCQVRATRFAASQAATVFLMSSARERGPELWTVRSRLYRGLR